jgi:division protein CdvB (Snf7/Vps24/ESCRT-III family)
MAKSKEYAPTKIATGYPKAAPSDYPKTLQVSSNTAPKVKKCEKGSCDCDKCDPVKKESCGIMNKVKKERIKKAIDRLQDIMKTLDSLDTVAKSQVMDNFQRLMDCEKGFLDQSIENLQKMAKDFLNEK